MSVDAIVFEGFLFKPLKVSQNNINVVNFARQNKIIMSRQIEHGILKDTIIMEEPKFRLKNS